MLSIKEFIKEKNYDIENLYIDKFWDSISNNTWIYINDNMLKWMGYNCEDLRNNKKKYLIIIKDNFKENENYKLLNTNDFKNFYEYSKVLIENNTINEHNKVKHLIICPKSFKKSLMLLKTEKSYLIRDYYIELEDIFKDYLKYQNEYQKLLYEDKIKLLEQEKKVNINNIVINNQPMKYNGYIYICTTDNYAKLNIFKIGKSVNVLKRIEGYNSCHKQDDEYYLCYQSKTIHSEILEKYIFSMLRNFHHKGELYQIRFDMLLELVEFYCNADTQNINLTNYYICNLQEEVINKESIIPKQLYTKSNNYIKDKYNNDCINENKIKSMDYLNDLVNLEKNNHEEYVENKKEKFMINEYKTVVEKFTPKNKIDDDFLDIDLNEIKTEIFKTNIVKNNIIENNKLKPTSINITKTEYNTVKIFLDELIETYKKEKLSNKIQISELYKKYTEWYKIWLIENKDKYKNFITIFKAPAFKDKVREYGIDVSTEKTKKVKYCILPLYNDIMSEENLILSFLIYIKNNEELLNTEVFYKKKDYNYLITKLRFYDLFIEWCKSINNEFMSKEKFYRRISYEMIDHITDVMIEGSKKTCVDISSIKI